MPTAGELFGDELAHLVTGFYPGGIKKSEIMHKCYRTPGPILTAAHGIGMGLLRPGGMLSGITRTPDWQALGYEVTGRFTRGQQITLRRLSDNSPNVIPQLWKGSVIEFEIFSDRISERVQAYMTFPHQLNQVKANAFELGDLTLQDTPARIQRHFWKQLQTFDTVSVTYVATPNGDFIAARRTNEGTFLLQERTELTEGNMNYYAANNQYGGN